MAGTLPGVTLWSLPIAFGIVVALLALATDLEARRVRTAVRMAVRAKRATPELAEAIAAAELAPVLRAHGFGRT